MEKKMIIGIAILLIGIGALIYISYINVKVIEVSKQTTTFNDKQELTNIALPEERCSIVQTGVECELGDFMLIEDSLSIKVNSEMDKIINEELSDYTLVFSEIIEIVKKVDPCFDPKRYKVTFVVHNEESGYGHIAFGYFIDNKIQTNKGYIANFEEYEITEIILAGVRTENIEKMDTLDYQILNDKIGKFEVDKEKILLKELEGKLENDSILNSDGTINISSIKGNVIEYEEKYTYDYNTDELRYFFGFFKQSGGSDGIIADDFVELIL